MNETKNWTDYNSDLWKNNTISISDPSLYGSNITLTRINEITLNNPITIKTALEEKVENLEKQLNKIIEFINKFFDTEIKT